LISPVSVLETVFFAIVLIPAFITFGFGRRYIRRKINLSPSNITRWSGPIDKLRAAFLEAASPPSRIERLEKRTVL
jgi:hypothetical protein